MKKSINTFPISLAQLDIYVDQLLNADSPLYNIGGYIECNAIDVDKIKAAYRSLVERHGMFGIRIGHDSDDVYQYIDVEPNTDLPIVDFSSSEFPLQDALTWYDNLKNTPINYEHNSLCRAWLVKLGKEKYWCASVIHHLAIDGLGYFNLCNKMGEYYNELPSNKNESYGADWQLVSEKEQKYVNSQRYLRDKEYWRSHCSLREDNILHPHYRNQQNNKPAGRHIVNIPRHEICAIEFFAKQQGVSVPQVFLGMLSVYFTTAYNRQSICFGVHNHNRRNHVEKKMLGSFTGVKPLFLTVKPENTFAELITEISLLQKTNLRHQRYPLSKIVHDLSLSGSGMSLFEVTFNYLTTGSKGIIPINEDSKVIYVRSNHQNTPLDISIWDDGGHHVEMQLGYDKAYFNEKEIQLMATRFEYLLTALRDKPDQLVSDISILPESEIHQQLVQWNDTAADYPADKCIHELFEAQVEQTPDAIAVVFEDESLSYSELNARANQLAHYLVEEKDITPDTLVGICVERSLEMMIGIMAILKAGGGYVPLDPQYPKARLDYIVSNAQLLVVLTKEELLTKINFGGCTPVLIDKKEIFDSYSTENLDKQVLGLTPSNLAYVIYTSGSTGQPKGVMLEHNSVVNYLSHIVKYYFDEKVAGTVVSTSLNFDGTVTSMLTPLVNGRYVELLTDNINSLSILCKRLTLSKNELLFKLTPSHLLALNNMKVSGENNIAHRLVLGGEKLSQNALKHMSDNGFTKAKFINHYGPTETTVGCAVYEVNMPLNVLSHSVPIGRPLTNTELFVLNSALKLIPVGMIGELHIGGKGLARGYLNKPELTAERFIDNPYYDETNPNSSKHLYKSGDLVRYLADGNLEFIGRMDDQVKIRGFRIELGEIESSLSALDDVNDVVVVARETNSGDKSLVAYVVTDNVGEFTGDDENSIQLRHTFIERLRQGLNQSLPDYMVPSGFVVLDKLPLSPNGKIDRKALPTPDMSLQQAVYVAPDTATEKVLCEIWQTVLGLEQVGLTDNFFELGGHSLLAMRLIANINQKFDVTLALKSLFNQPTVSGLSSELLLLQNAPLEKGQSQPALTVVSREAVLPPSYAQQRLWLLDKITGDSAHYNMPGSFKLTGDLNRQALMQALTTIIERHESLRTHFVEGVDGQPVQIIQPLSALTLDLPVTDLSSLAQSVRTFELAEQVGLEARKTFDLSSDVMLRAQLIKLSDTEHVLLITIHHIACDGWSINILINELSTLYTAYAQGLDHPLAPLAIQYADYAYWQRNWLQGEVLDEHLGYWTEQLANLPVVHSLPLDKIRPATQTFAGATHLSQLSTETSQQLKNMCLSSGATLFMGLHAAFSVLLSRYSNETDIVVGSPIANREQAEVANLIGFFVNTPVLRCDLSDNPSFSGLLEQSKKMLLDAYAHQQAPFEALVEKLQPARSLSHSPLFQVMLVLQNNESSTLTLPDLELSSIEGGMRVAKYDLTLNVSESEDGLLLDWEYNTDLFEAQSIERLAGNFEIILDSLVKNPTESVFNVEILSEAQRDQQLVQWNDTAVDYPINKCIHELFEEQAEKTPNAIAVVFEDEQLTYSELNAKANQLAYYLIDKGVKPDTLMGLCVERSFDMVIGLMGILKAGGAYVPLDPDYPQARLEYIIEDARLDMVLTQRQLADKVPVTTEQAVYINDELILDKLAQYSTSNINPDELRLADHHLAYVIYTSGSTGLPKGVMIEHSELSNFISSMSATFSIAAQDSLLAVTSLSFDIHTLELYFPLVSGSRLIIASKNDTANPDELYGLMDKHNISIMQATPSTWKMLDDSEWQTTRSIQILCGGEALSQELSNRLIKRNYVTLWNMYGPTETCVWSLMAKIEDVNSVIIGKPIDNTQCYVISEGNNLSPIGVAGELYIGGMGLARGYLNQPTLTVEKFIQNPFYDKNNTASSMRLYKTGDLCRYLPDGNIEFMGRLDNQVKIRGFRIELGEIESSLSAFDEVTDTVVVAREISSGDKSLVAYVVIDKEGEIIDADKNSHHLRHAFIEQLRQGLHQYLPDYMVPSAFVMLDKLPLTPNGKIDRKALPAPDMSLQQAVYVAPTSDTEKVLCTIWQEVLGLEQVGITDNFFELGGHSILIMKMMIQIKKYLNKTIETSSIFKRSTIQDLGKFIDCLGGVENREKSIIHLSNQNEQLKTLYCIPGVGGIGLAFTDLARATKDSFNIKAINHHGIVDSLTPHASVVEAATEFLIQIRKIQPAGPYYLVGHSAGGQIAFEMALQLRKIKQKVFLVFIDVILVRKLEVKQSDETQEILNSKMQEEEAVLLESIKQGEGDRRIQELLNQMDEELLKKRIHQVANIMSDYAKNYIPSNVFDGDLIITYANDSSIKNDELNNVKTLKKWCSGKIIQRYAAGDHFSILMGQGADEVSKHIKSFIR